MVLSRFRVLQLSPSSNFKTILFIRSSFSSLPLGGFVHYINLGDLSDHVRMVEHGFPLQEWNAKIKLLSGETTCSLNFKIFLLSNDFFGGFKLSNYFSILYINYSDLHALSDNQGLFWKFHHCFLSVYFIWVWYADTFVYSFHWFFKLFFYVLSHKYSLHHFQKFELHFQ